EAARDSACATRVHHVPSETSLPVATRVAAAAMIRMTADTRLCSRKTLDPDFEAPPSGRASPAPAADGGAIRAWLTSVLGAILRGRATASDALEAQPAGDDAFALVLAEGVGDHRPHVHVLRAEAPAGHAGVVSPSEEAAALEDDRVVSSESQADVHDAVITDRASPWRRAVQAFVCLPRPVQ